MRLMRSHRPDDGDSSPIAMWDWDWPAWHTNKLIIWEALCMRTSIFLLWILLDGFIFEFFVPVQLLNWECLWAYAFFWPAKLTRRDQVSHVLRLVKLFQFNGTALKFHNSQNEKLRANRLVVNMSLKFLACYVPAICKTIPGILQKSLYL